MLRFKNWRNNPKYVFILMLLVLLPIFLVGFIHRSSLGLPQSRNFENINASKQQDTQSSEYIFSSVNPTIPNSAGEIDPVDNYETQQDLVNPGGCNASGEEKGTAPSFPYEIEDRKSVV